MRSEMRLSILLLMLGIAAPSLLSTAAQAADLCTGHKMLAPRPEFSCSNLKLRIYPSPDRTLHAVVYPADIRLDVTPDRRAGS